MIDLKSEKEIELIAKSAEILSEVLIKMKEMIKPGITTEEIDGLARKMVKDRGVKAAFLGYRGYPAAVCVSVNEEVVHGIPSSKIKLKEGDIVSLDFGVEREGFFSDAALTVPVGKISGRAQKLIKVTQEALLKGIDMAKPGNRISDISAAVQRYVEANGFSVVRDLCGHGVGRKVHEEPMIPNFGKPGQGPLIQPGMVLAIEPMVNAGSYEVATLDDEWTVVTMDGAVSAHFEHTVAVTENGPVILTRHS
ncbi:MAG TPA: type I methionyl aminopeptidase [Candidatus Goldiibacteriota bacterium]|nr:type I methionyl aminopeptidase [Candidatus Goldiibacteriota bacterium]HRQ42953.1 type I methionyl aminopeptidase [Candidatus Goldiibacteriota bacterium]